MQNKKTGIREIHNYLSDNLLTDVVYDHDILIPHDISEKTGMCIQLKRLFGVGQSFKF